MKPKSGRKSLNLPRLPQIRQSEKVHEKKSKERKVKHPKADNYYDDRPMVPSSWNEDREYDGPMVPASWRGDD